MRTLAVGLTLARMKWLHRPQEPNPASDATTGPTTVDSETLYRLIEREDQRLRGLRGRASGLAGFAGIIVALSASFLSALSPDLSRPPPKSSALPLAWRVTLVVAFVIALVLLLMAIWFAVMKVIKPASDGGAAEAGKRFTDELTVVDDAEKKMAPDAWIDVWRAIRKQNEVAAHALTKGYYALLGGLGFVAAEALIVVLYAVRFLPG